MFTLQPLYLILYSLELSTTMAYFIQHRLPRYLHLLLPVPRYLKPAEKEPFSIPAKDIAKEFIIIKSIAEYNEFLNNLSGSFSEVSLCELPPSEQTCNICRRRYDEVSDDFFGGMWVDRSDIEPWRQRLPQTLLTGAYRDLDHNSGPAYGHDSATASSNNTRLPSVEDFQDDFNGL